MRAKAPTFLAEVRGDSLVFNCPFCRCEHVHGAPDLPGHRAAACAAGNGSPFSYKGYRLVTDPAEVDSESLDTLERVKAFMQIRYHAPEPRRGQTVRTNKNNSNNRTSLN